MTTSPLIDANDLKTLLELKQQDILVVDCRYVLTDAKAGRQAYTEGHIPGAVYGDLGTLMSGPSTGVNGRHPLPDPQAFADGMADLGANNDTLIVAYDEMDSMFASRLWWLLHWIGHTTVRVLNGGLQAWRNAGGELSTVTPTPARGDLGLRHRAMPTATYTDVLALVQQGRIDSKEKTLIDARAPDRFRGENETIDPVGGHIPGAINRFFKENVQADGRFKSPDQLRSELEGVFGDTDPQNVVHQCGSGVSACHNLLAMEIAGLPGATLYPGSWSEWCHQSDAPKARG